MDTSNFIVFDIRAGGITHDRLSEIAIAVVNNGEIVDRFFEKVTPPKNPMYEVDFWQNHGERNLKDVWIDVKPYFEKTECVLAFNLSVHKSNLEKSLAHYNIKAPEVNYLCVYNWAKKVLPLEYVSFDTVAHYLEINLHEFSTVHLNQANVTAQIALKLESISGLTVNEYYQQHQEDMEKATKNFFRKTSDKADLNGLIFDNDLTDFSFEQKSVVFTGNFSRFPDREKLAELLSKNGALIKGSISSKTQIVIVGSGAGPSKIEKVKELLSQGKILNVISEENLYSIIETMEEI